MALHLAGAASDPVVGGAEIEEELRALGIAEPEFMDTDGQLLPPLEAAHETD